MCLYQGTWELVEEYAKCDGATANSAEVVESVSHCQDVATDNYHAYVSYRMDNGECYTSTECDIVSGTDNEWVIYFSADIGLCIVVMFHMISPCVLIYC